MFRFFISSTNYSLPGIYLVLCLFIWMVPNVQAQSSACIEEKLKKGKEDFRKKKYNDAINLFFTALINCPERPNVNEITDIINEIKKAQMAIEQDLTTSRDKAIAAKQIAEEALKIAEKAREEENKARIEADKNARIAREKGIQAEMLRLAMLAENQRNRGNYSNALLLAYLSIKLAGEQPTAALQRAFAQAAWDTLKKPLGTSEYPLLALYPVGNGNDFWGLQKNEQLVVLHEGKVAALNPGQSFLSPKAITYRGDQLLVGSTSGQVWWWGAGAKNAILIKAHAESILATSISNSGQYWLSASRDNNVKLWSAEGSLIHTFEGHQGNVYSAVWSPDDHLILTRSSDNSLRLWDASTKIHRALPNPPLYCYDAIFSASGQKVLAAGYDGKLYRWDILGNSLPTLSLHQSPIRKLEFSPKHHYIYSKGVDSTLALLSPEGEIIKLFNDHNTPVTAIGADPQGTYLALGLKNHEIQLFKISSQETQVLRGHQTEVIGLEFSKDGQSILSTSKDGTIRLWDIKGDLLLEVNLEMSKTPIPATFSKDGSKIIIFSDDNRTPWECPTPSKALSDLVAQELGIRTKIEQIKHKYSILFLE